MQTDISYLNKSKFHFFSKASASFLQFLKTKTEGQVLKSTKHHLRQEITNIIVAQLYAVNDNSKKSKYRIFYCVKKVHISYLIVRIQVLS